MQARNYQVYFGKMFSILDVLSIQGSPTHGNKSLTIPAIVYFINSLHGQSSVRDRGEPTYLYIGDVSYKTINYN